MGLNILQIIFTFVFAVICLSTFLYNIFLWKGIRFGQKQITLFLLSTGIFTSVSSNVLYYLGIYQLKAVINISIMVLLMYTILKQKIVYAFLYTGLYSVILAFAAALASFIFSLFEFKYHINESGNILLNIAAYIIMLAFQVVAAYLFKQFKSYIVLSKEVKARVRRIGVINLIFALIMVIANFTYYTSGYAVEKPQLFLNMLLIIAYFLFSIYNINTAFRLESKSEELEYQVFYNKTLEAILNDLRRSKHNYNNILAVINGYVMVNRWDGLKSYMRELIQNENRESGFGHLTLVKIKNAGLFGLISNKLAVANEKGIDFKIYIEDEITEVETKISLLCEILGILLDNAIEASELSSEKIVEFKTRQEIEGGISFTIENTVKEMPDINKIFQKSYSTKGDNRGMGLWIIKNIIRKNKNIILNTYCKDNKFIQELIVS